MSHIQQITPCLWFDTEAEDAARFYTTVFPHSRITAISRYGEAGKEIHGKPPGSVLTVAFDLDSQPFTALNGGSNFKFSPAVSFQVHCDTQDAIDRYWDALTEGGEAGRCGWLTDRFGLSWQIVPSRMAELIRGPGAMTALMGMQKLDIAALERAGAG